MATSLANPSVMDTVLQSGAAPQGQSEDPNIDAPQTKTGDQIAAVQKLDDEVKAALMNLRKTFKMRYMPKRMRFIQESMRAFEAFRGNTYALLNDQSAALDTITQLMAGFLGQGDDPQLYAHNDNIFQAFGMIYIACLMVDLGKTRYQPADAQDVEDQEIAKKASTIQAFNERKNDITSLQQLELLYLWLTGSYFTYVRYTIGKRWGTTMQPQMAMQPQKVSPDGYVCPTCGKFSSDDQLGIAGSNCPNCHSPLAQKDWFEGPEMDLPVKIGEIEVANGQTTFTIFNGLMVDINPDAIEDPIAETEILDLTIDTSVAKVRAAFPAMYTQITNSMGSDAAADGDMAKTARAGMTTPGSNSRPLQTEGLISYSRCWITPQAFYECEEERICQELVKRYPDGCKLVLAGPETFLDARNESLLDHWTWCGTIKGLGSYPPAAGKSALDVQERVTAAVNKIDAYMDRVAYGTMFYDADRIDGNALQNKVLTPGNMTPISRTDEETGQLVPLEDLVYQMKSTMDSEIYKYPDALTQRAQFLVGVMPQVFGGSDKNVQTAEGQEQSLNTALGRLKQYINQMRAEKANRARLSVKCSVENMDEEIKIVEQGDAPDSWQTVTMLKAELTGDFFTYPETDEGFPATYAEIQSRLMNILAQNQKQPFVTQLLADPKIASVFARYLLPPEIELPADAQLSKVEKIIHRLSGDKRGPMVIPNPKPPMPGQPPPAPITIPSIMPEAGVDDPAVCGTCAKDWLLKNWEQAETNPNGYANVLAYFTVSNQMAKQQQAAAALTMQAQAQHGEANGAGAGQ